MGATPALAEASQPTPAKAIQGVWRKASPSGGRLIPLGGAIPFTTEGRKQFEKNRRLQARGDYDSYDIAMSRCASPGTPRLMLLPERFKIWELFGVYTFDFEWNRALRLVDASAIAPRPDPLGSSLVPSKSGDSKGRWDGDTLVVVTTNISDRSLLDDLVPHTQDAIITERLRLVSADTLEDRVTVADPAYFTRPWDAVMTFKREQDAIFPEDVCLDRRAAHQPAFPSR